MTTPDISPAVQPIDEIPAGLPWLAFVTLCYFLWARRIRARLAE